MNRCSDKGALLKHNTRQQMLNCQILIIRISGKAIKDSRMTL